jgi:hypothetical protein
MKTGNRGVQNGAAERKARVEDIELQAREVEAQVRLLEARVRLREFQQKTRATLAKQSGADNQ